MGFRQDIEHDFNRRAFEEDLFEKVYGIFVHLIALVFFHHYRYFDLHLKENGLTVKYGRVEWYVLPHSSKFTCDLHSFYLWCLPPNMYFANLVL